MGIAAGLGNDQPCRRFSGSVPARSDQALVRTAAAEILADKDSGAAPPADAARVALKEPKGGEGIA